MQDIETEIQLQPASTGLRFANLLIDIVVFYVIMATIGVVYGFYLTFNGSTEALDSLSQSDSLTGSVWTEYLLIYTLNVLIYTSIEGFSKGRSLGKLITGTKAVNIADASSISYKTALMRSLSRIVPFEPFSALGGHPWHDRWTDTMVVKIRR